jgi:hypothetical protein
MVVGGLGREGAAAVRARGPQLRSAKFIFKNFCPEFLPEFRGLGEAKASARVGGVAPRQSRTRFATSTPSLGQQACEPGSRSADRIEQMPKAVSQSKFVGWFVGMQ